MLSTTMQTFAQRMMVGGQGPDPNEKRTDEMQEGDVTLPLSPHGRAVVIVCDAGPLIARLESGIPTSDQLMDGFLKIPLPDWEIRYSNCESRAQTLLTASPNNAGTHPFNITLGPTEEYLGADGSLSAPLVSYTGLIQYELDGAKRCVRLEAYPELLARIFERLENLLQEPAVRKQRHTSVRDSARLFANDITWVTDIINRVDEAVEKAELPSNLAQFLIDPTAAALKEQDGDGYYYQFESLKRARMFSFSNGESIALARIEISWNDEYGNSEYEDAIAVVGARAASGPRFFTLLMNPSFSPPRQRELFGIAKNLTKTSD